MYIMYDENVNINSLQITLTYKCNYLLFYWRLTFENDHPIPETTPMKNLLVSGSDEMK